MLNINNWNLAVLNKDEMKLNGGASPIGIWMGLSYLMPLVAEGVAAFVRGASESAESMPGLK